jgi:hypothetical protein
MTYTLTVITPGVKVIESAQTGAARQNGGFKMTQTKCLVIGSCTGRKASDKCPNDLKLKEIDFETAANLAIAEQRAKGWIRPVGQMYTGMQHKLMMRGIERLRTGFSPAAFDVAIISAGYGLITEGRKIAPYNIRFQKKDARARGKSLDIPAKTRKLISRYQVIFFLLGQDYLASLDLPLDPAPAQKFIYFGRADTRPTSPARDVICIPAGPEEYKRYGGAWMTDMKGSMFDLLATELCAHPQQWKSLLADRTASTLIEILDDAKKAKTTLH